MGESVPNASSVFSHRRSRADSTTSFAYLEDDQDHDEHDSLSWSDEDALLDVEEETESGDAERRSLDAENTFMEPDMDEDDDEDELAATEAKGGAPVMNKDGVIELSDDDY